MTGYRQANYRRTDVEGQEELLRNIIKGSIYTFVGLIAFGIVVVDVIKFILFFRGLFT